MKSAIVKSMILLLAVAVLASGCVRGKPFHSGGRYYNSGGHRDTGGDQHVFINMPRDKSRDKKHDQARRKVDRPPAINKPGKERRDGKAHAAASRPRDKGPGKEHGRDRPASDRPGPGRKGGRG